jgi:hypothetical protein
LMTSFCISGPSNVTMSILPEFSAINIRCGPTDLPAQHSGFAQSN